MKRNIIAGILLLLATIICFSFRERSSPTHYAEAYRQKLKHFESCQQGLLNLIGKSRLDDSADRSRIRSEIHRVRCRLKGLDFWLRYLPPNDYRKINGPLPVEWETEVFEKFEKPYRREGGGLMLAEIYLDEPHPDRDSLSSLIRVGLNATRAFAADTVTNELRTFHHFFLCNRLFLLNLAAIYTTGFECPDTSRIIPELKSMLEDVRSLYDLYDESFPATQLTADYRSRFNSAILFVKNQPKHYSAFNHFEFIRRFVNPLFSLNAAMIRQYGVVSHSLVDYSLNKSATSIFSKQLYFGQQAKGIFSRVKDTEAQAQIARIGKLLFYDPILSGNNARSCASCHKPAQCFTDTSGFTAAAFDQNGFLLRNTPSLINAEFNHLLMMDGSQFTLQHQALAVATNPKEMDGMEAEILRKVRSCPTYRKAFEKLLPYTPQEPEISFAHIASALTSYYCGFSNGTAPFDDAMNECSALSAAAERGFNLFMGKAQCGTCHFVPQFNGVKPPYVGSEFEVLGVPADTAYKTLSADSGRYLVNPAPQTMFAFRTGTLRNVARTAPYMHNGVFRSLRAVIDFYDKGGGAGHGLTVPNQTLCADPLRLTEADKAALIAFLESLTENIPADTPPAKLPHSSFRALNCRKPGGIY